MHLCSGEIICHKATLLMLNIATHTHTHTHTHWAHASTPHVLAHPVSSDSMSASRSEWFQSRQWCWSQTPSACVQSPSHNPTYPYKHTLKHTCTLIYTHTILECQKMLFLICFLLELMRVGVPVIYTPCVCVCHCTCLLPYLVAHIGGHHYSHIWSPW